VHINIACRFTWHVNLIVGYIGTIFTGRLYAHNLHWYVEVHLHVTGRTSFNLQRVHLILQILKVNSLFYCYCVCTTKYNVWHVYTCVLHSNFCELKFEICTTTKLSKSVLRWSQACSLSSHELNDVCIPHTFSRFLSGISLHCHILLSNCTL